MQHLLQSTHDPKSGLNQLNFVLLQVYKTEGVMCLVMTAGVMMVLTLSM